MDVGALTAFLAPCLGFLLGSGKAVAEAASERLGEQVWKHATGLWARLKPAVDGETVERVAEHPEDAAARGVLSEQIQKALASDPGLAADVERLWGEARQTVIVSAGDRGVAAAGSIIGSYIVTGDQVTIRDVR